MNWTIETLKSALSIPDFDVIEARRPLVPAARALQPPPPDARIGAVLALFYPAGDEANVVLCKRPETLRSHPGQIAFPGGKQDDGETLLETAVRETHEEIGVPSNDINIVGQLDPFYIPPSNFYITPFVGWTDEKRAYVPSEVEVEVILDVPISHFMGTENIEKSERTVMDRTIYIPYFKLGDHQIWGATSVLLAELGARVSQLSN